MTFRLLLGIDLLAATILAWFFLTGLADGSVSAFNIRLWVALLVAAAIVLGSAIALRRIGRTTLASVVLAVPAVPVLLYGLFVLAVVLSGESWN